MNNVIISGASSFIGQALAWKLLEEDVNVYGLCVHPEKLGDIQDHPQFHMIQVELQDYGRLLKLLPELSYSAFFHFAWQGYSGGRDNYDAQLPNIGYSCDAAAAAAKFGCRRFVFADSFYEFMKSENAGGSIGPCSVYGAAKRSARELCQVIAHNSQMEFIGVMFSNIFGVGDRSARSINVMLRQLLNGKALKLTEGRRLYDWTYIDDCIGGVIAAARKGKPGTTYYIGSGQVRPFREIAMEMRDAVAPKAELRFGEYPDDSFVDYQEIDLHALYRDTGYLPSCNFRESILKTAEWVKSLEWEG